MSLKEALRRWLIGILIPATRPPDPWAEHRARVQLLAEQERYYARRAEDARMRYLMNPGSQQAPPTDWYR